MKQWLRMQGGWWLAWLLAAGAGEHFWFVPRNRLIVGLIDRYFPAATDLLEVGCGTGTLAIAAQRRQPGVRVSAVDADSAVLAIAARKARHAGADMAFDLGRSSALPYADGHFDRVLSSLFFHHLAWGDKLLTAHQMHRVRREGNRQPFGRCL